MTASQPSLAIFCKAIFPNMQDCMLILFVYILFAGWLYTSLCVNGKEEGNNDDISDLGLPSPTLHQVQRGRRRGTSPDGDEDAESKRVNAERELRDRLRIMLGMRPRQTTGNLSLPEHARNHGVNPSFDLPVPLEEGEEEI